MAKEKLQLSDEQLCFIKHATNKENILVDACIGSGKTTTIQELCCLLPSELNILYLTYNRLLKVDAKQKIKNKNVTVTNYHGFASMMLMRVGVSVAPSELIQTFIKVQPPIPQYDLVVFDEYQDIDQEISDLLDYIALYNPNMQKIAVGDMDQKIYDKTTLRVREFIQRYLGQHTKLKFTKCFRISEDLGNFLGSVWKKDINGVNTNCSVEYMNIKEAAMFIMDQKPKDILCVGNRRGDMARVLNYVESIKPDVFNKQTVYASIRNQDANIEPKKTNAIFTTYDACKGMERRFCIVFDFDEDNWQMRLDQPQQSYEILRNIFCVAASRGKEKIIFVQRSDIRSKVDKQNFLSQKTLLTNPGMNMAFKDVNISEMFDFKYKEDIEDCFNCLQIDKVDMLDDSIIDINDKDALIDLSPCVGIYQEASFFKGYDIDKAITLYNVLHPELYCDTRNKTIDEKILYLTSLETAQKRYVSQIKPPFVTEEEQKQIHKRLSTIFSRDEISQMKCSIPFHDNDGRLLFSALGLIDIYKNNTIYELKFVNEVEHTHFLQCASYMLAMQVDDGVLWNVKKNEYYKIRIKDRIKFFNLVASTITKHAIEIAHETDDIKKKLSVNSGLMGYAPINKNKPQKTSKTKIDADVSDDIAVLDVETNFDDNVISIGVVIASKYTYRPVFKKYFVITPECDVYGMYTDRLFITDHPTTTVTRDEAIHTLERIFAKYKITSIFAYNASFDYRHLPEIQHYRWFDIMKVAAYKQHNPYLSSRMEYCNTGRLKSNYGAEDIMRLLTASRSYKESHNALIDAMDELKIMELLGLDFASYRHAEIK